MENHHFQDCYICNMPLFLGDCYIHDMPLYHHSLAELSNRFLKLLSWFSGYSNISPVYILDVISMLPNILPDMLLHMFPCLTMLLWHLFFLCFSTSQTMAVVTVATWQPFCWPWSYYLCWQPTCVCSALRCIRSSKNPAPWRSGGGELIRCDEGWFDEQPRGIFTNRTWWFYQHKFGVIVDVTDFC